MAHTLSVCSFLRNQCWNKIMSCVLRGPLLFPPKVECNPGRTDPVLVFTAVKKMAPSSREAIGPEVPDECPFSAPSPRGSMVQKFPMHAYSKVSFGVCKCATNDVVQFFVVKSTPSSNTSKDLSFQFFVKIEN